MCVKCPDFTVVGKDHTCVTADKMVTSEGRKYSPYKLSSEFICNHENYLEHTNICVSHGVLGPISDLYQSEKISDKHDISADESDIEVKGAPKSDLEDQYFFTSNRKFKAPRIQYLRPKVKTSGFVFGLMTQPKGKQVAKLDGRRLQA